MITPEDYRELIRGYVGHLRRYRFTSILRERNSRLELDGRTASARSAFAPYYPFVILIGPSSKEVIPTMPIHSTVQGGDGPTFLPASGVEHGTLTLSGNSGTMEDALANCVSDESFLRRLNEHMEPTFDLIRDNRFLSGYGTTSADVAEPPGQFLSQFYRVMATLTSTEDVKRKTFQMLQAWAEEPNRYEGNEETFVNLKAIDVASELWPFGKRFWGYVESFGRSTDADHFRRWEWNLTFKVYEEERNDFLMPGTTSPPTAGASTSFETLPPEIVGGEVTTFLPTPTPPAATPTLNLDLDGSMSFDCALLDASGRQVLGVGVATFDSEFHDSTEIASDPRFQVQLDLSFDNPIDPTTLTPETILLMASGAPLDGEFVEVIDGTDSESEFRGASVAGRSWSVRMRNLGSSMDYSLTIPASVTHADLPEVTLGAPRTVSVSIGDPCPEEAPAALIVPSIEAYCFDVASGAYVPAAGRNPQFANSCSPCANDTIFFAVRFVHSVTGNETTIDGGGDLDVAPRFGMLVVNVIEGGQSTRLMEGRDFETTRLTDQGNAVLGASVFGVDRFPGATIRLTLNESLLRDNRIPVLGGSVDPLGFDVSAPSTALSVTMEERADSIGVTLIAATDFLTFDGHTALGVLALNERPGEDNSSTVVAIDKILPNEEDSDTFSPWVIVAFDDVVMPASGLEDKNMFFYSRPTGLFEPSIVVRVPRNYQDTPIAAFGDVLTSLGISSWSDGQAWAFLAEEMSITSNSILRMGVNASKIQSGPNSCSDGVGSGTLRFSIEDCLAMNPDDVGQSKIVSPTTTSTGAITFGFDLTFTSPTRNFPRSDELERALSVTRVTNSSSSGASPGSRPYVQVLSSPGGTSTLGTYDVQVVDPGAGASGETRYRVTFSDAGGLSFAICSPATLEVSATRSPCDELRDALVRSLGRFSEVSVGRSSSVPVGTAGLGEGDVGYTFVPPEESSTSVVTVSALSTILFEFGSDEVRSEFSAILSAISTVLLSFPNAGVEVHGHTDNRVSDDSTSIACGGVHTDISRTDQNVAQTGTDVRLTCFNLDLSRRRASNVSAILQNNGVLSVTPRAFGETVPVAPNATGGQDSAANRRLNRRVEIVIQC